MSKILTVLKCKQIDTILVDTLEGAETTLTGQKVTLSTRMANETAKFTIESVSYNSDHDEYTAWVVRPGKIGGHHVNVRAKRK